MSASCPPAPGRVWTRSARRAGIAVTSGLMTIVATLGSASPVGAGDLPQPVPVPTLPAIEDQEAESARLIPVPAGCVAPSVEQVVFIGKLIISDAVTGRFEVEQVLSGSIDGFSVSALIDVRYGDEVSFLVVGQRYVVGGAVDPEVRVLSSTVRAPAPLFGGNEIAGADDADVDCPRVDTPVRTLLLDGSSVETGVLTPLKDAERSILRAILAPVGGAFLVLLGLVIVKHLFFALGRSLRDLSVTDQPSRRQRRKAATAGLDKIS